MLTESDPRRANWLTISGMSEDLYWPPEETGTSRPNWELEAEILRLTTRLMMRERELRQVKAQVKSQASKAQQQVVSWRRRVEEKEEQLKEILVQKDAEMQNIVSQLLLFEAELRREQSRIEDQLSEKDSQILSQQREIERLRRSIAVTDSADLASSESVGQSAELYRSKPEPEYTSTTACNSSFSGDRRKHVMEDRTSSALDNVDECATKNSLEPFSVMDSAHVDLECFSGAQTGTGDAISDGFASEERANCAVRASFSALNSNIGFSHIVKPQNNCVRRPSDSAIVPNSLSGTNSFYTRVPCPSSCRSFAADTSKVDHKVGIYEDPLSRSSPRDAIKIRAIQDVTNVKSLDPISERLLNDRKRVPLKSPQKMKDLKAKRINPHKIHRHVMPEMTAQAIL